MLRRMQRRVNRAETEELLDQLRRRIPNLVLRTTFITGFPGETDEQFQELLEFVRAAAIRAAGRVHLFARSRHAGGPVARPSARRSERVAPRALMAVQQEVAFAWNEAQVGRQLDVLLDCPAPDRTECLARPHLCRCSGYRRRGLCHGPAVEGRAKSSRAKLSPPASTIWSPPPSAIRGRCGASERSRPVEGSVGTPLARQHGRCCLPVPRGTACNFHFI